MKPAFSLGFGKALLVVGALAGLIFGAVACADPEGTTPECVQDVGDGTHEIKQDGCNQFAVCVKGDKVVNAEECCMQFTNDYEHKMCLYGYGAGPAPNASGGGG